MQVQFSKQLQNSGSATMCRAAKPSGATGGNKRQIEIRMRIAVTQRTLQPSLAQRSSYPSIGREI
jgi:hypothetical protein